MKLNYLLDGQSYALEVQGAGKQYEIEIDGERFSVELLESAPPRMTFLFGQRMVTARAASGGDKLWIHVDGTTFELERADISKQDGRSHVRRRGTGSGIIVAPMPGQVRAVLVKRGDRVTEGQPLVRLEAMKMELQVTAPHDGIVARMDVVEGQQVEREQLLGEVTRRDVPVERLP